jgi:hypothetical protein
MKQQLVFQNSLQAYLEPRSEYAEDAEYEETEAREIDYKG